MTISITHRGNSSLNVENTLPALTSAIAKGADMVEIDLKLTKDGRLVVLHDHWLTRIWGVPRRIHQVDWSEVQSLERDGHHIPSFDEVLSQVSAPIMVDAITTAMLEGVLETSRRMRAMNRCLFVTGDPKALAELRSLDPEARIGLTWERRTLPDPGLLNELGIEYLNAYWRLVGPRLVGSMHAMGYRVSAWSVDRPRAMKHLLSMGVDAVVTNRIEQLVRLLH